MSHIVVDDWMREGRVKPKPLDVERHIAECEQCRRAVDEADELRALFASDEPVQLSESAAAEMRFRLEAAARQPVANDAPAQVFQRRRWAGAAAVFAAAAALTLWFRVPPFTPDAKNAPIALGVVTAEPGALIELVGKAPAELYRLTSGTAHFEVVDLERYQSFVVEVGSERVVVRGTSYDVEAESGVLMAVRVSEGIVEVELEGEPNPMLHAGEVWVRPSPDETADADADADADTDADAETVSVRTDVRMPRVNEPAAGPSFDALFQRAWSLHRQGHGAAASAAFDRLLTHPDRGEREADVLFWSAQSHLARGNETRARARLERLLSQHPQSLRAADARRQLGEL